MKKPTLAVVTTVYNHGHVLPDALFSVRMQLERPAVHVIVDDASEDEPGAAIAEHQTKASFPVIVIQHDSNRGHAAALNTAIRAASTDFVVKLDADDALKPSALATIAAAILADPTLNVVYAPFQTFGDFTMVHQFPPFDRETMTEECQIPGPSAFKRELWEAVGGFDETMRYGEDWDFWVRAERAVGLNPRCLPTPLWHYRTYRNWKERHADQEHQHLFKPYWRGHRKDNIGQRTWATFIAEQEWGAVVD